MTRESRTYALERANEAMGYKPSKGAWTEIFIVVAIVTALLIVMKAC